MSSAAKSKSVNSRALPSVGLDASDPPGPPGGLYLHIPFCARKCDYCAFYSDPSLGLIDRTVEALILELQQVSHSVQPYTIFAGGGTPTILNLRQWERLLTALHASIPVSPAEWTVEANPATLSLDKARLLRQAGVNRISMGVQSLNDTLLDRLGRIHSRKQVFQSFDILRQAGFDNVNLDLMFAIPGQTLDIWLHTLGEIFALQSEHLSCYEVIYEEDTPLFRQLQTGQFEVDEDLACTMYEVLQDQSSNHGFHQYEIANFARTRPNHPAPLPAYACQHNVTYWRGRPFVGIGPSACSFTQGVRTRNWANTTLYCQQLEQGRLPIESSDTLSPLARAGEIAAFGLRLVVGWNFDEFHTTTGFDLRAHWQSELNTLTARGWGTQTDHGFCLTPQGLRFADAAAELFLHSDPVPHPPVAT